MRKVKGFSFFASLMALTLLVSILAVPAPTQAQTMSATMTFVPSQVMQGEDSKVIVQIAGFQPNESITIWQTYPDYTVNPIGNYAVNSAGIYRMELVIDGNQPVGEHHFSARGNMSGIMVIAPFEVLAPEVNVSQEVYIEVTTDMDGTQGESFMVTGSGYHMRELVSIWITLPDGTVQHVANKRAKSDGSWSASLSFSEKDPIGQYFVTGYGVMSERTGVASFIVTGGDFTAAAGTASLVASPSHTEQLEVVELYGSGFTPGEEVSIWITMSDGTVWFARTVIAMDGTFVEAGYMPASVPDNGFPIGTTTFTAYGQTSNLVATASVELHAGNEFYTDDDLVDDDSMDDDSMDDDSMDDDSADDDSMDDDSADDDSADDGL
jgi:hypothetical protein